MGRTYLLLSLCSFVFTILFGGYGLHSATKDDIDTQARQSVVQAKSAAPMQGEDMGVNIKIKLIVDGQEAIAELYDNPTSRDFAAMTPMTLRFKDYNGTEKIAALPRALSLQDAPKGFRPSVGDLTLFAPWGNLAIFYQDFHYSEGLVSIGRVTSGMEILEKMERDFTVHIERMP